MRQIDRRGHNRILEDLGNLLWAFVLQRRLVFRVEILNEIIELLHEILTVEGLVCGSQDLHAAMDGV